MLFLFPRLLLCKDPIPLIALYVKRLGLRKFLLKIKAFLQSQTFLKVTATPSSSFLSRVFANLDHYLKVTKEVRPFVEWWVVSKHIMGCETILQGMDNVFLV